jgi:hypothetical protein
MTTCILVAKLIACTIVGPTPTPAESAAILAPHQFVLPSDYDGPWRYVARGNATDGPYGRLTPLAPALRLDGTSRDRPPAVYGQTHGRGRARGGR